MPVKNASDLGSSDEENFAAVGAGARGRVRGERNKKLRQKWRTAFAALSTAPELYSYYCILHARDETDMCTAKTRSDTTNASIMVVQDTSACKTPTHATRS